MKNPNWILVEYNTLRGDRIFSDRINQSYNNYQMESQISYNEAGSKLEEIYNWVISSRQPIQIIRKGYESVSLMPTEELLPSRQKNTYSRSDPKAIAVVPKPAIQLSINTGYRP